MKKKQKEKKLCWRRVDSLEDVLRTVVEEQRKTLFATSQVANKIKKSTNDR